MLIWSDRYPPTLPTALMRQQSHSPPEADEICDADMQMTRIDASYRGATHDSLIWIVHPLKYVWTVFMNLLGYLIFMMLHLLFAALLATVSAHHEQEGPNRAVVNLVGNGIQGNITFTQLPDGKVHVEGLIMGLPKGHYGFHVHQFGDTTGGCGSTGSHFNPEHKDHGHPSDDNRHVGDLGNVVFDENHVSKLDIVDSLISLVGPHNIIGRAVVLHEKADDFGRTDHPDSRKTGNAGGRVACGVIGRL